MIKNEILESVSLNEDELANVTGGNVLPGQANFVCQKCGAGYTTNVSICNKFVDGVKCGGSVVFNN